MELLTKKYLQLQNKVTKRLVITCILILIGITLMGQPNPITHNCVPNIRTRMGLSTDGYPLPSKFCETGYYPELKFEQEGATAQRLVTMFFVLVPLSLLLPVAYILIINRIKNK